MKLTNSPIKGLLMVTGLLMLVSCSTTQQKAGNRHLEDLFIPATNSSPTAKGADYGNDRLEKDYKILADLTSELNALADEMAQTKRALLFNDEPYLSDEENKHLELLLFRFINARDALWDMTTHYRTGASLDPDVHIKGAVLGMSAGLKLNLYSSYFTALFQDQKDLIKVLNTAHPSYEIQAGLYQTIYDQMTSIDNLERLHIVWYLFCKDLADPQSSLFKLQSSDPRYRELIEQMDGLYSTTRIQSEYVLYASHYALPDLQNRLHHSRIAKLGDDMAAGLGSGSYKTRGLVFKDVARIKNPTVHILQFSEEQVGQIKAMLQPGDILLTYTAGYMSNVFLPGKFKHGITYIGTVEQRRQAGLTDTLLLEKAVSESQGQRLIEHVALETTPDGDEVNIVEAVAEGVVLHSLDKLLETHINRLVVLRPRISQEERLEQLVSLMQYIDTPYDFKFDFQNDAYQCCTEVVYRTINKKGSIDFSLIKMRGVWILAADDILRYSLEQNPDAFEFIFLADQSSNPDDDQAAILKGSLGLKALYKLMDIPEPVLTIK